MKANDAMIEWPTTTWEGSRREQLRRWQSLTLRQRLEALDDMQRTAAILAAARAKSRLRDPDSPA